MRRRTSPQRPQAASDNRKEATPVLKPGEADRVAAAYQKRLAKQPLADNTRRAYLGQVRQYCAYLDTRANDYGNPLTDANARDYAIRDFKTHLKKSRKLKPASVNLALAALDHLYLFLGLGRPNVRREDLPQQAPRALEPEEQKRFLRAVERCPSVRDQAIAILLFYTALRIGECAGLDLDDVALSARKGTVTVRAGKADAYREVALNADARGALAAWLTERKTRFSNCADPALFLNPQGQRLLLPGMEIRLFLGMKNACLHGSKRQTAALTAMAKRIAPPPRQWFASPGCIRPQPAIDPATGLGASQPQSISCSRKTRATRFARISTAVNSAHT